jgi:hypothetical protein
MGVSYEQQRVVKRFPDSRVSLWISSQFSSKIGIEKMHRGLSDLTDGHNLDVVFNGVYFCKIDPR